MTIVPLMCKSQLFCSILMVITAVTGDSLLKMAHHDTLRAMSDSVTHGIIGGLSWLIVASHYDLKKGVMDALLCALLSSAIDVDHFIAAHSFSIKDAVNLPSRPFLHSTSLALSSCIFLLLLLHSIQISASYYTNLQRFVWLCITAFLSHHIRDGNRRGLWLWPLPFGPKFKNYSTPPIPKAVYIGLLICLPHIISYLYSPYSGDVSSKGFVQIV